MTLGSFGTDAKNIKIGSSGIPLLLHCFLPAPPLRLVWCLLSVMAMVAVRGRCRGGCLSVVVVRGRGRGGSSWSRSLWLFVVMYVAVVRRHVVVVVRGRGRGGSSR